MSKQRIVFRCDGNAQVGYGHLIRSISLAERLADEFEVVFACSDPDDFLYQQTAGYSIIALEAYPQHPVDDPRSKEEIKFDITELLRPSDIVVLDGYRFGELYRKSLVQGGARLVCIDDIPNGFYPADVLINPGPSLTPFVFEGKREMIVLAGLKYSLLRSPFLTLPPPNDSRHERVLLAIGGTDLYNLTAPILEKIVEQTGAQIAVIVTDGFSGQNRGRIDFCACQHPTRVRIYKNLSAAEMVQVMDTCKWAVLPSSGILIEAISRRITPLFGYYANNQLHYYDYFKQQMPGNAIGDLQLAKDHFFSFNNLDDSFPEGIQFMGKREWLDVFHKLSRV